MNIITDLNISCDECGAKMVLRMPKPGQEWQPFWGCSTFPKCSFTLNIDDDGLPEEPDPCDGWIDDFDDC